MEMVLRVNGSKGQMLAESDKLEHSLFTVCVSLLFGVLLALFLGRKTRATNGQSLN